MKTMIQDKSITLKHTTCRTRRLQNHRVSVAMKTIGVSSKEPSKKMHTAANGESALDLKLSSEKISERGTIARKAVFGYKSLRLELPRLRGSRPVTVVVRRDL